MGLKLDETAFGRLLDVLAPERDRAAQRYEEVRRRLIRFFEWRRCGDPVALTDEVIDRVARRLAEGERIQAADPGGYFFGVARNVWHESLKKARREQTVVAEAGRMAPGLTGDLGGETEAALACLERCLGSLPLESRALVLQYYQDRGIRRIECRRRLAQTLAIEPGTLRIRMLRIRERLESCVTTCLARNGVTESGERSPMNWEGKS